MRMFREARPFRHTTNPWDNHIETDQNKSAQSVHTHQERCGNRPGEGRLHDGGMKQGCCDSTGGAAAIWPFFTIYDNS